MFSYSFDNKRYHTLNYDLKTKYGKKVFKVSLNAGFGCPNKKKDSGCIFCSHDSGDFAGLPEDALNVQFQKIKTMMEKKWPDSSYLAYFQAGTNTYASLDTLKTCYEQVLTFPNVVGLNIATRSDAISNEVYDYLEE